MKTSMEREDPELLKRFAAFAAGLQTGLGERPTRKVVEHYADPCARRHVRAAFNGEAEAALWLAGALSNAKRGPVARAMWEAKVARPAYRAYLAAVWDHDHWSVIEAAESRRRLAYMFRYAQFPIPEELASEFTVWRGTANCGIEVARQGYSWTNDRDVACWFAMRQARYTGRPLVLRAVVAKAEVAFANDLRDERELVILKPPRRVVVDGAVPDWTAAFTRYEEAKRRSSMATLH